MGGGFPLLQQVLLKVNKKGDHSSTFARTLGLTEEEASRWVGFLGACS